MTELAQELYEGWSKTLFDRGLQQPKPWAKATDRNREPWFSFAEAVRGNQQRETN
jgi:hypothetical protein